MNEPNHDSDELASAYLDDELDPTDRAIVDKDPELRATASAFESLSSRIAEGVEPPAGSFDIALDAAVDELAAEPSAPKQNTVIAFKRRGFAVLAGFGAAAAAVIGLVIVAGPSSDDDDVATSGDVAAQLDESSAADGAPADAATTSPSSAATEGDAAIDAGAPEELAETDNSGSQRVQLLDQFNAATLLIELNRITALIDRIKLEPLEPNAEVERLFRSLDECGTDGAIVLIDSIENVEVVVIESSDRFSIVIPESCEVIRNLPIG